MAAMKIGVKAEGDAAMRRKLEHVASDKGMRKQARGALKEVGESKTAMVRQRVPVLRGRLLRSVKMKVLVSAKKEDLRITIIAGGPDALHARKVHETHKTHSKYMESVIREAAQTIAAELGGKLNLSEAVG